MGEVEEAEVDEHRHRCGHLVCNVCVCCITYRECENEIVPLHQVEALDCIHCFFYTTKLLHGELFERRPNESIR
jgi:hypothetical protein